MKTTIATLALALTSVNAASLRSRTGLSKSEYVRYLFVSRVKLIFLRV